VLNATVRLGSDVVVDPLSSYFGLKGRIEFPL